MIFVVLGMHKSGTTLIAKILHKSGIDMGLFDESINYDQGNHYERLETQTINKSILDCGNSFSLEVYRPYTENVVSLVDIEAIESVIEELNNEFDKWGFKDPRTALTYPLWKNYLGKHKSILIYRDPLEVWRHYQSKNNFYKPKKLLRTGFNALRAWYNYNYYALASLEDKDDFILINYTQLMRSDNEFSKLANFVGQPLMDLRDQKRYRSRCIKKPLLYNLYLILFKFFINKNVHGLYKKLEDIRNHRLARESHFVG